MTARRLLGTRYYRQRRKARAALYRRAFGRIASFRKAWRARRAAAASVFAAFFAAFVAARNAHRYQPIRRAPDAPPLPRQPRARRPMGKRYTARLRRKQAKSRLERYGLDVLGPDGKPDPETRRALRRARKQERQARQ